MGEIFNVPTGHSEWIKYRLMAVDKDIAKKVGDFDKDGEAGTIKDYADYYAKNKRAVEKHMPFFAAAARFDAKTARMSGNDFIHNVMSLAASAMRPEEIAKAYAALTKAYSEVWRVVKGTNDPEKRAVAIMKALGPTFKLLTKGVTSNRKVYAEPAIFGGLIAAQMGLEGIGAVIGPKDTVYLRYKKHGKSYYLDSAGKRFTDLELRSRVSNKAQEGVYLAKLTKENLLAMMVLNRGYVSLKAAQNTKVDAVAREVHKKDAFGDYFVSAALLGFKQPLVWKSMGNTFLGMKGMWRWAEFSYKMALIFDGGYAPALSNLGIIAGRRGSEIVAIKYYEAAVFYEPNFPQAYLNMCTANLTLGRNIPATRYCTAATRYDITAATAYIQRAKARLTSRVCDTQFIGDLIEAIKRDPEKIPDALNVVIGFNNSTNTMKAREYDLLKSFLLEQMLPRAKTSMRRAEIYTTLGGLHKSVKKNDLALKAFKKAVATNPSDWRGYYEWARFYAFETKEYAKAIEKLDETIAAGSDKAEVYYTRGIVRLFQKKYVAALPDLITAAKREKSLGYQSFGMVTRCIDKGYFKTSELPKVRSYLDALIKVDDGEEKAYYYYRAKVNKLMGDTKAAAEDAKKAAKNKPAPKCKSVRELREEL